MTLNLSESGLGLIQSNGWRTAFRDLRVLDGGVLAGGALSYTDNLASRTDGYIVNGHVTDSSIEITVQWENGPKGYYSGKLNPTRRLVGVTYDINQPVSQATWVSQEQF